MSWKACGIGLASDFFLSKKQLRICIAAVLGAPWGSRARQHIGTQQKYAALYWTLQFRTREQTEIMMWCEGRGPRNYYCCLNSKGVIALISLYLINPLWTEVIETCDFAIENLCLYLCCCLNVGYLMVMVMNCVRWSWFKSQYSYQHWDFP